MLNVIICEGTTDLVLLQYLLEKNYEWEYIKTSDYKKYTNKIIKINHIKKIKWFKKNDNFLCIIPAGGCSKICSALEYILDINSIQLSNFFQNIVILTDNDDIDTPRKFINNVQEKFGNYGISFQSNITNNDWNETTFKNTLNQSISINFLPLIIPFDENGAIETFLLNAIKNNSIKNDLEQVDKLVVEQCINFIENIDCKDKYLNKRRDITKAKFDTVFVVMTPADAFAERQNLLRNVPWHEYELIRDNFKKLSHLG